eukprot:7347105-Pyramimonas_sp.AAC.1
MAWAWRAGVEANLYRAKPRQLSAKEPAENTSQGENFETYHLWAANTSTDMDTWYGDRGHSSLIDYICCPTFLRINSSGPLAGLGRKLQLIKSKRKMDHLPMHLNFDLAAGPPRKIDVPLQWD